MSLGRRLLQALLLAACACLLVRAVLQAARQPPLYNWDLVSYVGLAIAYEEDDPAVIHRRTIETLTSELPGPVVLSLIGGPLTQARLADPAAFDQFMAFHRGRVLYTLPVYLLHKLGGVELTRATWWISRGAWLALACLLCLWSARAVGFEAGLVLGTALAHAPWLVTQMSFSSPDLLATLLACLGVYLLVERRRDAAGAAVLTAGILARPDALILCLLLAAALWHRAREAGPTRRLLALWAGAVVLLHLALVRFAGSYGWWPLFRMVFVEREPYPASIDPRIDLGLYWDVLRSRAAELPYPGYFLHPLGVEATTLPLAVCGVLIACIVLARRSGRPELLRHQALFAALLASCIVRWLLFPQLGDRFFAVAYASLGPACCSMGARLARGAPPLPGPGAGAGP